MSEEFGKYDTEDNWIGHNLRLTDDAREIAEDLIKITVVSTSRNENDADMWIDILLGGGQAEYASRLKKGDFISATGKLTMHRFGENDEKIGFQLRLPRLHYALPLLRELGERGAQKGKGKTKPAAKGRGKGRPAREVIDLDDDE